MTGEDFHKAVQVIHLRASCGDVAVLSNVIQESARGAIRRVYGTKEAPGVRQKLTKQGKDSKR